MPFTLSHAAAVLPALRRTGAARGPLVASALVAGSFAPDMTYYADTVIPGAMEFGDVTHGLPGVLTVDVLITAALVGGWLLVREPLLALLPRARRGRVQAFVRGRPWRPRGARELAALVGWFMLSAVLGSATHVVWDAFTHPGRWGTRLIPGLNDVVGGLAVSTYLQYGTSAVAMVALGWFGWAALRARSGADGGEWAASGPGAEGATSGPDGEGAASGPGAVPSLTVRARLLLTAPLALCVLLGAVHRTLRAYAVHGGAASWLNYIPTVLFGAGAGLTLGLLPYAAAVRLVARRARRALPRTATVATSAAGAAARPLPAEAAGPSAASHTAD